MLQSAFRSSGPHDCFSRAPRQLHAAGICNGLALNSYTVLHEQSLIAAFVKRNKRDRYREILANPRLRHKFIHKLAHFTDFDPRYRLPIPSNKLFVDNTARELQKRQSPQSVFVISEDPELDQKELPLVEALQQVVGSGMGTVLSCIPGHLAFAETEDERYILERNDPWEKREYIRFVNGREEDGHVERGIFRVASQALEWQDITGADAAKLRDLQRWFGENLAKPASIGRDSDRLGACWFKTEAVEHISRAWEMIRILERHGFKFRKVQTDKPGYVIYEDEFQLVADPGRKRTHSRR